jgi:hypothetical protein
MEERKKEEEEEEDWIETRKKLFDTEVSAAKKMCFLAFRLMTACSLVGGYHFYPEDGGSRFL